MYKYHQIEKNWKFELVRRIKEVKSADDMLIGQPLLAWSAYMYLSALYDAPSIWVCLVIEENRKEVTSICNFLIKSYCNRSPAHHFTWRKIRSLARSLIQQLN